MAGKCPNIFRSRIFWSKISDKARLFAETGSPVSLSGAKAVQ
jgi:hypothetical protein